MGLVFLQPAAKTFGKLIPSPSLFVCCFFVFLFELPATGSWVLPGPNSQLLCLFVFLKIFVYVFVYINIHSLNIGWFGLVRTGSPLWSHLLCFLFFFVFFWGGSFSHLAVLRGADLFLFFLLATSSQVLRGADSGLLPLFFSFFVACFFLLLLLFFSFF